MREATLKPASVLAAVAGFYPEPVPLARPGSMSSDFWSLPETNKDDYPQGDLGVAA